MSLLFREHHLIQIADSYEGYPQPLDACLRNYFRAHKALGSKDRRFISETLYGIMRWRGLIDHLSPKPLSWKQRVQVYQNLNPTSLLEQSDIPHHIRLSFPKQIFELLSTTYRKEKAEEICLITNDAAPTTIRVNPLKISREELLKRWNALYSVTPCTRSSLGIVFHQRHNFFAMPEFKKGLFEVQDEASQLASELIDAKPGDHVLDFCAGAGGKTLAFAPRMKQKGQIYLHDIRRHALDEAKKRLCRAGIQNAQYLNYDDPKKERLKGKMDWVLVDAPCTGSGTWRRNPDMKWKCDSATLERLVLEQQSIFKEALTYLKSGGKIVYATCSLFAEENENQIAKFQNDHSLKLVSPPFKTLPEKGGMDGFFAAVMMF